MARGVPQPDSVKANPQAKMKFARLLRSAEILPGHRSCQWYPEIVEGKTSKEKFRKFFDVQVKKHYGDGTVRAARSPKKGKYSVFPIIHHQHCLRFNISC